LAAKEEKKWKKKKKWDSFAKNLLTRKKKGLATQVKGVPLCGENKNLTGREKLAA